MKHGLGSILELPFLFLLSVVLRVAGSRNSDDFGWSIPGKLSSCKIPGGASCGGSSDRKDPNRLSLLGKMTERTLWPFSLSGTKDPASQAMKLGSGVGGGGPLKLKPGKEIGSKIFK